MSEWQPIETAPKDRNILLYWPNYDVDVGPVVAIGAWKHNRRLCNSYGHEDQDEPHQYDHRDKGGTRGACMYFSDTGDLDDYRLSQPENAPTHWMTLPNPPVD